MFTDKGEFDGRSMCPYGPEQSGVSLINSQGNFCKVEVLSNEHTTVYI